MTSKNAMVTFLRRLANLATYYDPSLDVEWKRDMMGPSFDKELDMIRQKGNFNIPPTSIIGFKVTDRKQLICHGFTLTNK